jgi:hypothetical protein
VYTPFGLNMQLSPVSSGRSLELGNAFAVNFAVIHRRPRMNDAFGLEFIASRSFSERAHGKWRSRIVSELN